jgi:hypothetical protein
MISDKTAICRDKAAKSWDRVGYRGVTSNRFFIMLSLAWQTVLQPIDLMRSTTQARSHSRKAGGKRFDKND